MSLAVITLNVALYVVDLGNYFKKRCLHQTLEFKAEATVMCGGLFLFVFFNASCLCVHLSLKLGLLC